jgi:hypothetical protein
MIDRFFEYFFSQVLLKEDYNNSEKKFIKNVSARERERERFFDWHIGSNNACDFALNKEILSIEAT